MKYIPLKKGEKYGRLTFISFAHDKNGYKMINCKCDCGNHITIIRNSLRTGNTKSCGCLNRELFNKKNRTHGESKTKLYRIWWAMIERCKNKNIKGYENYGGRGIKVCDEWKNYILFAKWAKSNGYMNGLTLDRINNNDSYYPDNCRWVTSAMQMRNTRRNNLIEYNNEILCLTDWAKKIGISRSGLFRRLIIAKLPIEIALTMKIKGENKI